MINCSLGFDTSNYTTSVSVVSLDNRYYQSEKLLLPVSKGEIGLRQSDAVFLHTKQLPQLLDKLLDTNDYNIRSVCVSTRPRNDADSYMPCFLVGKCNAISVSKALNVPCFQVSHQEGHIAAILFGANRLDLIKEPFIAFHLSGGTTEAVLVTPDSDRIFNERVIARSLDLKAGQAIDRIGKLLGLDFPAGAQLDALAQKGILTEKIKVSSNGCDISISGLENKCKKMIDTGESKENIAMFCIQFIIHSLDKMISEIKKEYNLPLVFGGGVSSNSLLRDYFFEKYNAIFAPPVLSSDNAVGVAVIGEILRSKNG